MTEYCAERSFLERVNKNGPNGCWIWTGGGKGNGYGQFRGTSAHRWAYMHFVEKLPAKIFVCHKCDNPACVNPAHMFPGTQGDNMRDCKNKGRTARGAALGDRKGENGSGAKLTWDQVKEIRESPLGSTTVGRAYGVSKENILKIRKNMIWKTAG